MQAAADRQFPMGDSRFIGITMGCPVGIGPEIILRFLSTPDRSREYTPVVVGDAGVLRRCALELGIDISIVPWQPARKNPDVDLNSVLVMPFSRLDAARLAWGRPNRETGLAMAGYIKEAVHQLGLGTLAAVVTCPISKSALHLAGYRFPGHTEMLASLTDAEDYAMLMAGRKLRVTLVTIHLPLAQVATTINQQEVFRLIGLTHGALQRDFGIWKPRLAVAGLNPHAGEGGLFGDEEEKIILPAVLDAVNQGWNVRGPIPPDTVFHRAVGGEFDAVVCMYHDQGLIPFKLIHFVDGVNVTVGLPIVRTSVDHGTAYEIAGKGVASPASLKAAYELAIKIIANRKVFCQASTRDNSAKNQKTEIAS